MKSNRTVRARWSSAATACTWMSCYQALALKNLIFLVDKAVAIGVHMSLNRRTMDGICGAVSRRISSTSMVTASKRLEEGVSTAGFFEAMIFTDFSVRFLLRETAVKSWDVAGSSSMTTVGGGL